MVTMFRDTLEPVVILWLLLAPSRLYYKFESNPGAQEMAYANPSVIERVSLYDILTQVSMQEYFRLLPIYLIQSIWYVDKK